MSTLCLVLIIYISLNVSRSKACPKNLNKHRSIAVYCICKHSSKFSFNITLSVTCSIICTQLFFVYNNIYQIEHHVIISTNAEGHYG